MIKKIVFIIVLLNCIYSYSQDLGLLEGVNIRHFQLAENIDTIDFIKVGSTIDTIRPTIIFCQGSLPIPLIVKYNDGYKQISCLNFDFRKLISKYNLIIISMPHTPLEYDNDKLNNQSCYITNPKDNKSYSKDYLTDNYADNYIRRGKIVVDFLFNQNWVDNKKIILLGHSQGTKVALGIALNNDKVSCIGYLSGNPLGRFDQKIRTIRKMAIQGKITQSDAQIQIDKIYEEWTEICKNPNSLSIEYGDPIKTWYSFSKLSINDLLNLNKPIFIGYGTEDITSEFCELLPLYFIREGKNNLTLKPYVGLEHNFAEIDSSGNANYDKMHWDEVINDFTKWIEQR